MSDKVRNPEDRFSHNEAHIVKFIVVSGRMEGRHVALEYQGMHDVEAIYIAWRLYSLF